MVMVLMKLTPITAKARSRSELAWRGSTAEVAIAAAAPHTPVAQPVRKPKSRVRPNRRATIAPNTMVQPTAAIAITIGSTPPCRNCPTVSCAPYSATPRRSSVRPEKSRPGFSTSRADSGCRHMPMTSVTISGGIITRPNFIQPLALATKAMAAMAQQSRMPGADFLRFSGAHSRATSTTTLWLGIDHGNELAFPDRLAFVHADLLDGAGLGRQHGNLHLHRFQDHDLAFGLDLVAGLELDLPDIAGDFRLHVDDGHVSKVSRVSFRKTCRPPVGPRQAPARPHARRGGRRGD